jgi:MFS transporter, ACS family, glucarate transporter
MMQRYVVVFTLFVLSMITYIDRACISSAKDPIAAELGLDDSAMGLVFSAFALGYALAQIPSGWFADRAGPGIALATVVTAWSAFTGLTGWASTLSGLVTVRFLFGVAEAGAFPGSVRAIYNWLPAQERGRANGVLFSGSRIGAALSFPLFAWMLAQWHWRTAFGILGAAGIVWVIVWLLWFRDYPAQRVQRDDVPAFRQITIGEVFRSLPMALAMTQYFAGNFTFFLCLSWMHPYLKSAYRLSNAQAAAYTMAPLLMGATAQWVSGWMVDRLYRSRHRAWSRRVPAMMGFALAAVGIIAVSRVDSAVAAVVCFTVATFGADMTISPSWAFCTDLAGRNSGSVSAAMNMFGNVGSFVSANAFPWLFAATGSANAYFAVAAMLNVVSIGCWLRMRSV